MRRLPPVPRSAKPLHRHPGPLAALDSIRNPCGPNERTPPTAGFTRKRLRRPSWHKTLHTMPPRDRNATFPLPNSLNRP
jgi:hypothetical protein